MGGGWVGAIAAGPVGLALAMVCGCGQADAFVCASDPQCAGPGGGVCQPDGHCSFPADDCPSGQRYGEHSGAYSGQCVQAGGGTETPVSGSSTQAPDPDPAETAEPELTTAAASTSTSGATTSGPADPGDETTTGMGSTGTPVDPVDPDLVLWLELEGPLRGEVLDSSSLQSHGTCSQPACPELGRGIVGQGAWFDGDDDVIAVPHAPSFETTEALTIAAFIRMAEPPVGHQVVLSKPLGLGNDNSWELFFVSELFRFGMVSGGVAYDVPLPWSFPPDQWVHVAGTWDGGTMTLWVDGEAVGSTDMPAFEFDEHPVLVGADEDDGSLAGHFGGTIDDVRVYRRALTAEELAALASG